MKMGEMMREKKRKGGWDLIDGLIRVEKECKVDCMKVREFGMEWEDLGKLVENGRDRMGGVLSVEGGGIREEEMVDMFKNCYK